MDREILDAVDRVLRGISEETFPPGLLMRQLMTRGLFDLSSKNAANAINGVSDKTNLAVGLDKYVPPDVPLNFGIAPNDVRHPLRSKKIEWGFQGPSGGRVLGMFFPDSYRLYSSLLDIPATIPHEGSHAQKAFQQRKGFRPLSDIAYDDAAKKGILRKLRKAAIDWEFPSIGEETPARQVFDEVMSELSAMEAQLPPGKSLFDSNDALSFENDVPGILDLFYRQAYGHLPGYSNIR